MFRSAQTTAMISTAMLCLSCRLLVATNEAPPSIDPGGLEAIDDAFSALSSKASLPELPSRGCRSAAIRLTDRTHERSLRHDGLERSARVFIPSTHSPDTPAPLMFMLHGGGGSGEQFETKSAEMNPIAEREGFIVVYPDGVQRGGRLTLRTWNAGGCCGHAMESDADDVGFLMALLDELTDELCIDERRVYSAGMSNGAMMSYRLACEQSERIAAIAPVAAGQFTRPCEPASSVAVLHVHGTDDPNALYEGGLGCGLAGMTFPPVMEGLELWRETNACQGGDQGLVEVGDGRCEQLGACETPVVRCLIEGGGHSWPGGYPPAFHLPRCEAAQHSTSFPASEVIWRFFRTQALDDIN